MTVTIASRASAREVSRSSSRIWNARVAGKADPLWEKQVSDALACQGGERGLRRFYDDSVWMELFCAAFEKGMNGDNRNVL
jgi:hypothetical protein